MLIAGVLVGVLTAGSGTAWALERFVIPHVEVPDVSAAEEQAGTGHAVVSRTRRR